MGCAASKGTGRPPPQTSVRVVDAAALAAASEEPGGGPLQFKLVMCGDKSTGKSSLVTRFTKGAFDEDGATATIGAAFASKDVSVGGAEVGAGSGGGGAGGSSATTTTTSGGGGVAVVVRLQLWDTAGEELYRAMTRSFFREAGCGIIVYDVSSPPSFAHVASWLRDFREQCPDALAVLVANKVDVPLALRAVPDAEGEAFAAAHELLFRAVSAKTGEGVAELFGAVAAALAEAGRDRVPTAYG